MKISLSAVHKASRALIVGVFCLGVVAAKAQDPHFSNYRHSPLSLNPALAGMYVGDYRASFNFRNQWNILPDPFVTLSAGFDFPIYIRDAKFTSGLYFLNDKSGNPELNVTKVFASFGYQMESDIHTIGVSFQPGYVVKSMGSGLSFPDQFDNSKGEFNAEMPTNEPLANDNFSYLDMNAGIVYGLSLERFKPRIGFAFFHLTSPDERFITDATDENKLRVRTAIHASFKTYLTDEVFVDPHFYSQSQSKANNTILGANVGYKFPKGIVENAFFGISSRNGFSENPDAVILSLGAGIAGFDFAAAYDVNVSTLKTGAGSNGTFEISLIYTAPSSRIVKTKIDSERL